MNIQQGKSKSLSNAIQTMRAQSISERNGKVHPFKSEIIAALLAGEKWKVIEDVYDCSASTISRYKKLTAPR